MCVESAQYLSVEQIIIKIKWHGFSFHLVYCIQLCFIQDKPAFISAGVALINNPYLIGMVPIRIAQLKCADSHNYKVKKQQLLLTFFTIDIKMHQKQVWFSCSTNTLHLISSTLWTKNAIPRHLKTGSSRFLVISTWQLCI